MGKNLKGKECSKGIYQTNDGLYNSRFVNKLGNRHEKYFNTVPEAQTGLKIQSMPISMKEFSQQPKLRLMNGLNFG